jgi:import receptor subunit TOM20
VLVSLLLVLLLTSSEMATTSTSMSSWGRTSTIAAISVGAVVTGVLGYAIYFDHRRRTDPTFRRALKKESRRQEKVAKQEADAANSRQRRAIREAVEKANEEGFPSPTDSEEVENYFMKEVAEGEMLCQDRKDLSLARTGRDG